MSASHPSRVFEPQKRLPKADRQLAPRLPTFGYRDTLGLMNTEGRDADTHTK